MVLGQHNSWPIFSLIFRGFSPMEPHLIINTQGVCDFQPSLGWPKKKGKNSIETDEHQKPMANQSTNNQFKRKKMVKSR